MGLRGSSAGSNREEDTRSGEIVEPISGTSDSPVGDNYIIAQFSQYTERPDLLIEAIEKCDPGFVQRMNKRAEQRSDRMARPRFRFGLVQAYSGLFISVAAAVVVLGLLVYQFVFSEQIGFWPIIALVIFYAVSQGGRSGFAELIKGMADMVRSWKKPGQG
ncbi:MAG: hypothetical protein GDA36_11055 [Rhodobacteraceae bacterium]|nr:hypothetical protein [Paracoccaceae bacterium]